MFDQILTQNLAARGAKVEDLISALAHIGLNNCPSLVYGSALRQNFDHQSDIDIICCTAQRSILHRVEVLEKMRLDIRVYDTRSLLLEVDALLSRGQSFLAKALIDGLPITGNWRGVKEFCSIRISGKPPYSSAEATNAVHGLLSDMHRAASPLVRQAKSSMLILRLAEFYLLKHGHWISTGDRLIQQFETTFPERSESLVKAARTYVSRGDLLQLTERAKELLGVDEILFSPMIVDRRRRTSLVEN